MNPISETFLAAALMVAGSCAALIAAEPRVVEVNREAGGASEASSIYVYRPENPNGKAVVICPGGGYAMKAMDHEGHQVARWLADEGFVCAVLDYRLPGGRSDVPLADVSKAVTMLRLQAAKVGVMGFSAGGHLAASCATLADAPGRPDFQVLMYPVISMDEAITHRGTRLNLIGESPDSSLVSRFSLEEQVDSATPPAIMILSADDRAVPPENSLRYFRALRANAVPVEMHVYPTGGHGWGMNSTFLYKPQWQAELLAWLNRQ